MVKGIIFDFNRTLYNPDTAQLNDGTIYLLEELLKNDYSMCLVTKEENKNRNNLVEDLSLNKYFSFIRFVDGDKDTSDFLFCMDKMNLLNYEIVVLGDRSRSELSVGKSLGMKTIWYRNGKFALEYPLSGEDPDGIVYNLKEVISIIKYL